MSPARRMSAAETAVAIGVTLTQEQAAQLARDIARVARSLGRNTERLRLARLRVTQLEALVREDKRLIRLLASGRQSPDGR